MEFIPKFQITFNNQFNYRLKSTTGKVILSGQGYISQEACRKGIEQVKASAPYDSRYERKNSLNNNQYYFILRSANGDSLGRSEMYYSHEAREEAIDEVSRTAPFSMVEQYADFIF
ncbi:hypothetical protein MYP_426 [Sporocytophaga myxococcoides]|uniref:DUF1508 domain-containing protein n=1 Tax=Sporocytophaga myxococcoides TaxID=153721 RepID=A0A098L8M5_9BACT|nr:YegP family protein [Sporocytophaga myxococcoides]GAL83200.1 hypothetical protein MYP_426 [Sporocytophaga myxococcoides]